MKRSDNCLESNIQSLLVICCASPESAIAFCIGNWSLYVYYLYALRSFYFLFCVLLLLFFWFFICHGVVSLFFTFLIIPLNSLCSLLLVSLPMCSKKKGTHPGGMQNCFWLLAHFILWNVNISVVCKLFVNALKSIYSKIK